MGQWGLQQHSAGKAEGYTPPPVAQVACLWDQLGLQSTKPPRLLSLCPSQFLATSRENPDLPLSCTAPTLLLIREGVRV